MALFRWLADRRARQAACDAAEAACRALRPGEEIMGAGLHAEEAERYVVCVYCGRFEKPPPVLRPPWRECLVFAVARGTFTASLIQDDEPYRPRLR